MYFYEDKLMLSTYRIQLTNCVTYQKKKVIKLVIYLAHDLQGQMS